MKLGVIGGLGPMATAYYMELITKMTKADCDQEHLDMIIYSSPSIPDRTGYLLGRSDQNPLPELIKIGHALKEQGADVIVLLCMTAHAFHQEMEEAIGVPVIHGVKEVAQHLKCSGVQRVGVLATDGAIATEIFQRELDSVGIESVLPDEKAQAQVMEMIYGQLKAGKMPDLEVFSHVQEQLMKEKNAEVVVLGCTELSLMKKYYGDKMADGVVDVLEILAKASLISCQKEIRKDG